MDLQLRNKCVIVTGGAGALGQEIVRGFLREGAHVVATCHNKKISIEELYPSAGSNLVIHTCDLSSDVSCKEVCTIALREFGTLDIVVNNAAAILHQDIATFTDRDFDNMMQNTLRSTLYMMRAVLPIMRMNASGGRVVNMSSAGVLTANPNELLYLCAKAGVEAATRVFARLGAADKITVNAIAPHVIAAGMGLQTVGVDQSIVTRIPLGRTGATAELVSLVLYLSSHVCEYLNGQVVGLNGGRVMR